MFTYKGINSRDMGLRIDGNLSFESPDRDVDLISIAGRNGDLVMDNGRFESVLKTLNCRILTEGNVEERINQIHNWLATDVGYHDFTWSGDRDFTYQAMVENGVRSQRTLTKLARMAIKFRVHPIKYLTSSLSERQVSSGMNIANPFDIASKPIIRIVGNGNFRLNIGNQVLDLRDINRGITVDCETMTVTSFNGQFTEFDKMYSSFPELRPGNNNVIFNNDFQVFITSRFGVLV